MLGMRSIQPVKLSPTRGIARGGLHRATDTNEIDLEVCDTQGIACHCSHDTLVLQHNGKRAKENDSKLLYVIINSGGESKKS